jgi:uncharacterized membrane protein
MTDKTAGKILKIILIVLGVMTPVGLFIMTDNELNSRYLWTTTVFLSLQFIALMVYAFIYLKNRNLLLVFPAALLSGFLFELTGVRTGFPFGQYQYTEVLQPQISGVPVAISISWVLVVFSSYFLISKHTDNKLFAVIASGVLVLAFDILLEPFAAFINKFWLWRGDSVPWNNYLSWFLISVLFASVLAFTVNTGQQEKHKRNFINSAPEILLAINVLQFSVVNILNGYIEPVIAGILLFSAVLSVQNIRRKNEV